MTDAAYDVPASRHKRPQLPAEVATYVRGLIISGTVQPGEFLRMEPIAEAVGVSNTPVREGLLALQSEGFVRLVPRRGFVVAPFSAARRPRSLLGAGAVGRGTRGEGGGEDDARAAEGPGGRPQASRRGDGRRRPGAGLRARPRVPPAHQPGGGLLPPRAAAQVDRQAAAERVLRPYRGPARRDCEEASSARHRSPRGARPTRREPLWRSTCSRAPITSSKRSSSAEASPRARNARPERRRRRASAAR